MSDRGVDLAAGGAERVGAWGVVLRGMFLACSWTWCIGMFFPVFFVGDFGFWGWVAFAVPNVLGAGAMGWVLRRPGASADMVAKHSAAMRWFSVITIMFHLYFLSAFMILLKDAPGPAIAATALVGGIAFVAASRQRDWWTNSVLIYCCSAGLAITAWATDPAALSWDFSRPQHSLAQLLMAVPTLCFGFGLCPYLDMTFHRVRTGTPGPAGTRAFWVGFVVFFTPMIALTPFYGFYFTLWIILHIFLQSTFTIGAHARELIKFGVLVRPAFVETRSVQRTATGYFLILLLIFLPLWFGYAVTMNVRPLERTGGWPRLVYELFMSFYALVFPAYVWIVIIERGLPRRTRLTLYVASVILASPCLWLGYIEQRYIWLLPGVAIPVLMPLLGKALATRRAGR